MHTATMDYALKPEVASADAAAVWTSIVAEAARGRPGLVRLQLLANAHSLLAIGTWEAKEFAEDFMRTGVFVRLTAALGPYLASEPQPRLWVPVTEV